MEARENTRTMLSWWLAAGVHHADLAVRRRTKVMTWHSDLALSALPLAWARAENVRRAEVYIRPARQYAWPVVFLDDVVVPRALAVAAKYDALVVSTSAAGGCHVWLACDEPLAEAARLTAQRWLARKIDADLGSVSGEHLGRLAGFKNWKRGGTWVNVLDASQRGRRWDPSVAATINDDKKPPTPRNRRRSSVDTSASGREWGWACGQLENGCPPGVVYDRLLRSAQARRGSDASRYARQTINRAMAQTEVRTRRV